MWTGLFGLFGGPGSDAVGPVPVDGKLDVPPCVHKAAQMRGDLVAGLPMQLERAWLVREGVARARQRVGLHDQGRPPRARRPQEVSCHYSRGRRRSRVHTPTESHVPSCHAQN
jgi:hypothetical protein